MAGSGFLIQAGRRIVGSPVQRRELRAYVRYLVMRNRWQDASREALHAITAGAPNGNLPSNLSLVKAVPKEGSPLAHDFPLHVARVAQPATKQDLVLDLPVSKLQGLAAPWEHAFEDQEDTFGA